MLPYEIRKIIQCILRGIWYSMMEVRDATNAQVSSDTVGGDFLG